MRGGMSEIGCLSIPIPIPISMPVPISISILGAGQVVCQL